MGNISKSNLQDKDIRNLGIKSNRYVKAVGNPKELYIFIYPSGMKTFMLKYDEKYMKIKEFREGIYSVAEASNDANKLLKELESGKSLDIIKGKDDKYKFINLLEVYLTQQYKKNSKGYMDKVRRAFELYILPKFGNMDAKEIKASDLLEVLNAIFRPSDIKSSRLETIHRLINYIFNVFEIAVDDDYIVKNPAKNLKQHFPTVHSFYTQNDYDNRLPGLIDENDLREWIKDFKQNTKIKDMTRRMVLFQIYSANRPINTVKIKWDWIDFENKVLNYPPIEMKENIRHSLALSSYLMRVLEEQKLFSGNDEYVFPIDGHENVSEEKIKEKFFNRTETLNKAVKM
ncbi:MAG: site-specific integrase [Campylobacter sp.]|nr:site-specific integrase [Campylobacter sp.]